MILGDTSVGKSSIVQLALKDLVHYTPDNMELKYNFVEISGCVLNHWERKIQSDCYQNNTELLHNPYLAIMIFDTTNLLSFRKLGWLNHKS